MQKLKVLAGINNFKGINQEGKIFVTIKIMDESLFSIYDHDIIFNTNN